MHASHRWLSEHSTSDTSLNQPYILFIRLNKVMITYRLFLSPVTFYLISLWVLRSETEEIEWSSKLFILSRSPEATDIQSATVL